MRNYLLRAITACGMWEFFKFHCMIGRIEKLEHFTQFNFKATTQVACTDGFYWETSILTKEGSKWYA